MFKHLSLDDRLDIEKYLNQNKSFKEIGLLINKNCTTISREIRNHYVVKNSGCVGKRFNNCIYRTTCPNRGNSCKLHNCSEFAEEKCPLLNKPPYVCNGCKNKRFCTLTKHLYDAVYAYKEYNFCTLTKHLYDAVYAYKEYNYTLSETREGVLIEQNEINYLDSILVPLIKEIIT